MLNTVAIAAAAITVASAQYAPPATTVAAVVTTAAKAPEYYYADYDNVVVASSTQLYYTSALTPEAIEREKSGASASAWSKPKSLGVKSGALYNAKGATFCGKQYGKEEPEGGKYGSLVVADEGDAENPGKVVAWDVQADPADPAAVKLANPWTVYNVDNAAPTDVECGPNNGLFIADKGNKGIYWVTGADFQAKKQNTYAAVAEGCGAAVANVRSLSYDQEAEKLVWSNNDEAVVENAGVFEADQAKTGVDAIPCKADMCDAWSTDCSKAIKKAEPVMAGEKAWAVADAWAGKQVSKGGKEVYSAVTDKVVAEVPQEATYAEPAADPKRDVLFVADQKEGAVYAVQQNVKAPVKVADVADAYGVAYNNAWGWNVPLETSASSVAMALGSVVVLALSML
jgi:hypothetical protein